VTVEVGENVGVVERVDVAENVGVTEYVSEAVGETE
jgi:hypothetical protein